MPVVRLPYVGRMVTHQDQRSGAYEGRSGTGSRSLYAGFDTLDVRSESRDKQRFMGDGRFAAKREIDDSNTVMGPPSLFARKKVRTTFTTEAHISKDDMGEISRELARCDVDFYRSSGLGPRVKAKCFLEQHGNALFFRIETINNGRRETISRKTVDEARFKFNGDRLECLEVINGQLLWVAVLKGAAGGAPVGKQFQGLISKAQRVMLERLSTS